jgi:hypothetical protein
MRRLSTIYLEAIIDGFGTLNEESQNLIKSKVQSFEVFNGGFNNGKGEGDIYYTAFGLLLSYALGVKVSNHKKFLDSVIVADDDLINKSALIKSELLLKALKLPLAFRKLSFLNHTFSKSYDLPSLTTINTSYDAFLFLNILQELGKSVDELQPLIPRIEKFRNSDGGFPNHEGEISTLNSTVSFIISKYVITNEVDVEAFKFLSTLHYSSAGFKVSGITSIPDILSTATAVSAFKICEQPLPCNVKNVHDFVAAHWLDDGGFSATILDYTTDPEYIFYGLLSLGMSLGIKKSI